MRPSILLGKIEGIEIEVHFSWFFMFILTTLMLATNYFPTNYPHWSPSTNWLLGGLLSLSFFVSVLLHELAHSHVSIQSGLRVNKISLFIFGGVAQLEEEPDQPLQELKMALAGPLMSLILFAFFSLLTVFFENYYFPETIVVLVSYLANINLLMAAFNLVPAFPLDGGRVLRALIWHFKGNLKIATQFASSAGEMFGYFLSFFGIYWILTGNLINGIWFVFIGWFINQASQSSYQGMIMSDMFNKIPVREFMSLNVVTVDYAMSVDDLVAHYFYRYKYTVFPVLQDAKVIGLVDAQKVKELPKESRKHTIVGGISILLDQSHIVAPEDTVTTAMKKLFSNGVGRVIVLEQEKLLGILSRTDILNYMRIHNDLDS